MNRYGVPYMGSKNKLLRELFSAIPKRGVEHFYDLFCGGCSVTHYALAHWEDIHVHANDIDPAAMELFLKSARGEFRNERRWISREEFFARKEKDAYIRLCWSFGNAGREYLYAREREPWCEALHYARVYGDTSKLRAFGIESDGSSADIIAHHGEYKQRYIAWYEENVLHLAEAEAKNLRPTVLRTEAELREYLLAALHESGLTQREVGRRLGTQMESHYFCRAQWEFPTREVYTQMQTFLPLPLPYEQCVDVYAASLQSLQRLQSLQSLQSLQRLQNCVDTHLTTSEVSYDEVDIAPRSVVYCDIPYRDTEGYRSGAFDYEQFTAWCARQKELVLVSSYELPEDLFTSVWEKPVTTGLGKAKATERLFVPRHQLPLYRRMMHEDAPLLN